MRNADSVILHIIKNLTVGTVWWSCAFKIEYAKLSILPICDRRSATTRRALEICSQSLTILADISTLRPSCISNPDNNKGFDEMLEMLTITIDFTFYFLLNAIIFKNKTVTLLEKGQKVLSRLQFRQIHINRMNLRY